MNLEVLGQFSLDILDGSLGLGCQSQVVNKDWDNDPNIVSDQDKDAGVRTNGSEPHLGQNRAELLVPRSGCLFDTLYCKDSREYNGEAHSAIP